MIPKGIIAFIILNMCCTLGYLWISAPEIMNTATIASITGIFLGIVCLVLGVNYYLDKESKERN